MPDFIIRPVRVEDAEALNEVRRQPGVMPFTYALPSERIDGSRKFIENIGPDDHVFVAEVNGRAVGVAGIDVKTGKQRHVGTVGIAIHDDFQNRGIGRALLQALLDIADNYLGLIRVELEVFEENPRAHHLYETLGFAEEGRRRKAVFRNGKYFDTILMSRIRE